RLRAAIPLPADPAVRARIVELEQRFAEAAAFDKLGRYARAKAIVDELVPQARALGHAPLEAKVGLLLAGEQFHAGELAAAEQSYRDAAEAAARAKDDARIAQSWIDLMNTLAAHGKLDDALGLAPIARTAMQRVDAPRL